jgi:CMP/dCMP kinase
VAPTDPRPVRVAIDGPAGVGKSTTARTLAARLGFQYVDTGAMYRAVAVVAWRRDVDLEDESALAALAGSLRFRFVAGEGEQRTVVDGEDLSMAIREPRVSMDASAVSRFPAVRRALVALQQGLGAEGGVVMEGRDIATVVMPDAEVKVYLDADPTVRGARRVADLHARGIAADLEEVVADMRARDHQDSTREDSPLRRADGATLLDTTHLDPEQVIDRIVALARAASS